MMGLPIPVVSPAGVYLAVESAPDLVLVLEPAFAVAAVAAGPED